MEGKMMDAISRSELITFVKEKYHDIVAGGYPYNIVAWDLVRIIENFPALDVAPVVRAKWQEHHCTNCWAKCVTAKTQQDFVFNVETPYCPNCGARMDGEAE